MENSSIVPKGLNVWMLTALVVGNMIGSGIFLLPAALASFGSISLIAWGFTGMGAIFLGLVFAKLSTIMPRTGGPYAYCREGFGDFVGFQMAYNYWIALWVGSAGISVAFAGYLSVFIPLLKNNNILSFLVSAGAVWLMIFINLLGIRRAGMVQLVTTVLKILPLILIATLGLLFIKPENLAQFNISGKSNFSAITAAATLTLWAFVGLESATVPADDVDKPHITIPRATLSGIIITAIIYLLSSFAVMGILPMKDLMHSTSPFADAAHIMFGPLGAFLVAAGAVISCFGALNGWTLLQAQVPMAAARDNLFPSRFARLSRFGTPAFGLIFTGILITLLLLLTLSDGLVKQFTFIILLATLALLIPYFFTTMAELLIFIKYREQFNGKRLLGSSIIAIVGGIYSFWAIFGSGKTTVFYGCLLLFSSVPVYVWMKWKAHKTKKWGE